MQKKYIKKLFAVALLAAAAALSLIPIRSPKSDASDWMAGLEDGRGINTLSIPGTHDSGALYSFADAFGKCQSLPVPDQLRIGVRFLDIRLRLVDDELQVFHNFVEQKTPFDRLLPQLIQFLRENPSEFLIVSFKEEASPVRSEAVFEEKLEAMLHSYPDIISAAETLPKTVGEARGKLHIIARYDNSSMGLPCADGWESNTAFELADIYVQDHYKLKVTEEKLPDIEKAFSHAAAGEYALVLNFISCYLSSGFPPSYAGITAREINPWLTERLGETDGPLGVLLCDFITSDLAAAIIGRNFV